MGCSVLYVWVARVTDIRPTDTLFCALRLRLLRCCLGLQQREGPPAAGPATRADAPRGQRRLRSRRTAVQWRASAQARACALGQHAHNRLTTCCARARARAVADCGLAWFGGDGAMVRAVRSICSDRCCCFMWAGCLCVCAHGSAVLVFAQLPRSAGGG
jgi:hypothetical protein